MKPKKRIKNFSDKDQFIETGVIFPIAISSGRVTGEEVRIESTDIKGFHGSVSYSNSHAYGITPITGGLFLGEDPQELQTKGVKFSADHTAALAIAELQWQGGQTRVIWPVTPHSAAFMLPTPVR